MALDLLEFREARIGSVPIMPDVKFAGEAWCPRRKFCSQCHSRASLPARDRPECDENGILSACKRMGGVEWLNIPTANADVMAKKLPVYCSG